MLTSVLQRVCVQLDKRSVLKTSYQKCKKCLTKFVHTCSLTPAYKSCVENMKAELCAGQLKMQHNVDSVVVRLSRS